jgi:hypothetical protein
MITAVWAERTETGSLAPALGLVVVGLVVEGEVETVVDVVVLELVVVEVGVPEAARAAGATAPKATATAVAKEARARRGQAGRRGRRPSGACNSPSLFDTRCPRGKTTVQQNGRFGPRCGAARLIGQGSGRRGGPEPAGEMRRS